MKFFTSEFVVKYLIYFQVRIMMVYHVEYLPGWPVSAVPASECEQSPVLL